MSSIEKNCPTWACHHCFGVADPNITQHIFHWGCHPGMRRWSNTPNPSISVTCISRQCLILGQLDSSLPAGDQDVKWEGELPDASDSHRSFALWNGTSMWPSVWRPTPDILSPRSHNLAAIDMKLVAVNWNSGFDHSHWAQRTWQEIKQTTWFGLAVSLSHCLGLHLYATNGAPSQMWGCLLPGRKVVTYLQEPPSLAI